MQPTKRFLSRAEAAKEQGTGVYVIDQAILRGDLRHVKIRGRVLIEREQLENWASKAKKRTRQTTPHA
jgi:excisionase family DNA binding protein